MEKTIDKIKESIKKNGLNFIKISKDLNMNINDVKRIYNEELKELIKALDEAVSVTREEVTPNCSMVDIENKLDDNIVKYVIKKD